MSNSSTKKVFVGNRIVGKVKGGVFQKRIMGSRHILRKPCAIALSVESLRQAEELGAKSIEIKDTESGLTYSCDVPHFKRFCFELQRGGWEKQKALPLDRFYVKGGNPAGNIPMRINPTETITPAPVYETKEEHEAMQMSLFADIKAG